MPKKSLHRYRSINIYGERGRVILAPSMDAAIRKAPKNSMKVVSLKGKRR